MREPLLLSAMCVSVNYVPIHDLRSGQVVVKKKAPGYRVLNAFLTKDLKVLLYFFG